MRKRETERGRGGQTGKKGDRKCKKHVNKIANKCSKLQAF